MEVVEAFPIRFTRGVRSYWRRRKYHRLESGEGKARGATQQLGVAPRRLRVRVRAFMTAPRRALARVLALARKASAMALLPESMWANKRGRNKQLPSAPGHGQPTEFEQRLIIEIYKSIVASKELTTMLQSSASHRQTPAQPTGHLLDM
ncbi:hypothetical protein QOZ80_5AG0362200 [Eleusine coracana subsp. coracana]|nr:hypothetical protein QOZ80_5AG0362200 [Eleusine coracana subsp. coracana]